jgi:hypothetical protein
MKLLPEAEKAAGAAGVFQDLWVFAVPFDSFSRHWPALHDGLAAGPGFRPLSILEVAVVPIWLPVESPCRADKNGPAPPDAFR